MPTVDGSASLSLSLPASGTIVLLTETVTGLFFLTKGALATVPCELDEGVLDEVDALAAPKIELRSAESG